MQNKPSKIMTSKFAGTCSDCGRRVNAGETIRWLRKNTIDCSDCIARDTPPPVTANNAPVTTNSAPVDDVADQWDAAMSWDNDAPAPGASINANGNSASNVLSIVKNEIAREAPRPPIIDDTPDDTPDDIPDSVKTAQELPPTALAHVTPEYKAPASDPVTRIICDNLVAIVNAIDGATREQRAAIDTFARDTAGQSTPARGRIWYALADVVTA